ncbi:MAG: SMC-Scp complex subunit ScpB [Candidatus Hydrogenedentota bacterium]|nr:MAG: SMC-Scp complex subunit ScpB [Candidatus Hydrogenedentota bacterium]
MKDLKDSVEALLFISGNGMSIKELADGLQVTPDEVRLVLDSLMDDYEEREGGIFIRESSGKFFFSTTPKVFRHIKDFLKVNKRQTLSKSMLETLAIIAYRQPITLPDIEQIRGVNSRSMVTALLSKKLIKQSGVKEAPGRPALYSTTKEFLEYFGLNSLEELPPPSEVKELDFEEL